MSQQSETAYISATQQSADISAQTVSETIADSPEVARKKALLARFGSKLHQWKKGESGNPQGARTRLIPEMERLARKKREAEKFARSQYDMAQNPENPRAVAAAQLILDRVEGPVVQESRQLVAAQIVIVSDMPEPEWDRD